MLYVSYASCMQSCCHAQAVPLADWPACQGWGLVPVDHVFTRAFQAESKEGARSQPWVRPEDASRCWTLACVSLSIAVHPDATLHPPTRRTCGAGADRMLPIPSSESLSSGLENYACGKTQHCPDRLNLLPKVEGLPQ